MPLADKLRPKKIEDMVGQRHIIGKGKVLNKKVKFCAPDKCSSANSSTPNVSQDTMPQNHNSPEGPDFGPYMKELQNQRPLRLPLHFGNLHQPSGKDCRLLH